MPNLISSLLGILITAKNRQEFRIRLQKRARRKAEKRVDNLEEDKHNKSVRIMVKFYYVQVKKRRFLAKLKTYFGGVCFF